MSDHISKFLIEQFRDRALDPSALSAISMQLSDCTNCYELFLEARREKRANISASLNLFSEAWLKDEHLEYEQLVSYVENTLDPEDREIVEIHLRLCKLCRESVQGFV